MKELDIKWLQEYAEQEKRYKWGKQIKLLLTAYEKEKEKNKSLEQENSFLKMMYRGTDEFKAIENLAKEE